MEEETLQPELNTRTNKKTIIIIVIILAILAITAILLTKQPEKESIQPSTQEEKIKILEELSKDTEPLPTEEKHKILKKLSEDTQQQTISNEEKRAILESLMKQ